jgi:acylphosphatase
VIPSYEIRISGRVQGVGYRYFVLKQATILDLNGWVRNMLDGSVAVLVQGEEKDIDTLIDYLKIGPPLSRVTNISKIRVQSPEIINGFSVRY